MFYIFIIDKCRSNSICITVRNSPNLSSVYIRLCKHRKKVFYCFYKITFPRKKKNSLFRLLAKREILSGREVLYRKSNVRVISSCFAIKRLSKKGSFPPKMSAKAKKKLAQHVCKDFPNFIRGGNKVNLSSFHLKTF